VGVGGIIIGPPPAPVCPALPLDDDPAPPARPGSSVIAPLQAIVPKATARPPARSQRDRETGFLLSYPAFMVTPREALVEAWQR
jgi:hypothetical protein